MEITTNMIFTLILFLTVVFLGCESDDGGSSNVTVESGSPSGGSQNTDITGTWSGNDDLGSLTLRFDANGSFSGSGSGGRLAQGSYTVSGNAVSISYTQNENGGGGDGTATVSGNTMSGRFSNDGGLSSSFTASR